MKKFIYVGAASLLLLGCGTSRSSVVVKNNAEGTETQINVSGVSGGSTEVSVTPDVKVNVNFKNEPTE